MYELPFVTKPRPDTGFYNGKLGIWLVLAALVMFFGALYSSYVFLRVAAEFWPTGGTVLPLGIAALSVPAAALAAGCNARAWTTLKTDPTRSPVPFVGGALAAGIVFIILLLWQWMLVRGTGAHPAASNFYGLYFLFLVLHVALAVAGSLGLVWAGLVSVQAEDHSHDDFANRLECVGLFWQLNAMLWAITFCLFHVI